MEIYNEAKGKFGNNNVWTRDGVIFAKTEAGGIRKINNIDELLLDAN